MCERRFGPAVWFTLMSCIANASPQNPLPRSEAGPLLQASLTNALQKPYPLQPWRGQGVNITLVSARNEYESFQVVLNGPLTVVAVSAPVFELVNASVGANASEGDNGTALPQSMVYAARYVNAAQPSGCEGKVGQWLDPLVPDVDVHFNEKRNAFPINVPANQTRVVWVDVFVPAEALAGLYTSSVTVTLAAEGGAEGWAGAAGSYRDAATHGRTATVPAASAPAPAPARARAPPASIELAVNLTVFNFKLPSTPTLTSMFGFRGYDGVLATHQASPATAQELVHLYVLAGLANRITLGNWLAHGNASDIQAAGNVSSLNVSGRLEQALDGNPFGGGSGGVGEGGSASIRADGPGRVLDTVTDTDTATYYLGNVAVTNKTVLGTCLPCCQEPEPGTQVCCCPPPGCAIPPSCPPPPPTLSHAPAPVPWQGVHDGAQAKATPNISAAGIAFDAWAKKYAPLFNGIAVPGPNNTASLLNARLTSVQLPARECSLRANRTGHVWNCTTAAIADQIAYWRSMHAAWDSQNWSHLLFDYTIDEPADYNNASLQIAWEVVADRVSWLKTANKSLRSLVTTQMPDAVAANLVNEIDIYVPLVNYLNVKPVARSHKQKYDEERTLPVVPCHGNSTGDQRSQYANVTKKNLWTYQSCMSYGCGKTSDCHTLNKTKCSIGWPSYAIDHSGVRNRAMEWASYLEDVGGELYYETVPNAGPDGQYGWQNALFYGGNGDGYLMYPGFANGTNASQCASNGGSGAGCEYAIGGLHDIPIESARLKHVRDGFEDNAWLQILDGLAGRVAVTKLIHPFINSAWNFVNDPAQLLSARLVIGEAIEAHMAAVAEEVGI